MNNEIIILGTNEVAYTLAREYYELYNKKVKIFSQDYNKIMNYTKLAEINVIPSLLEEKIFLKILKEFYLLNQKDYILLIPTEIKYVELIGKVKENLNENFITCSPNLKALEIINDKSKIKEYLNVAENEIIIPQDNLYEISAYLDKNRQTKLISFSEIAVRNENNYPLVITSSYDEFGYKKEILDKVSSFLEKIEYNGFIQIILKRNAKMEDYEVVKINPCLSLTSYLFTVCNYNRIELLVKDLIEKEELPKNIIDEQIVINTIPYHLIKKTIKNALLKQQTFYLMDNGKSYNPLRYKKDNHIGRIITMYNVNNKLKKNIK